MDSKRWLDKPIHPSIPVITNEILIFAFVILFAIATRFFNLEARVMSHDESLHTYFSWLLYRGQGYQHSPMMHGPFQFHALSIVYFLFGANDFTSRIPAVLFSIGTVAMVWYWRRYLGKWGALIAGFLLVISPYMLYYGRYVRNESFVGFSGIVMLYAMLRHLEVGGKKYLYILAAALALHFTSKETSFIYTAQALLFLAFYFIAQVTKRKWENAETDYKIFIIALAVTVALGSVAAVYGIATHEENTLTGTETALPANPDEGISPLAPPETNSISLTFVFALAAGLSLLVSAFFLIRGYTWEKIRNERSLELLMIVGTIVLPQLSPFLTNLTDVTIPTSAGEVQTFLSDSNSIFVVGGFLLLTFVLAIAAGLIWNPEKFWKSALIFWVPFTILYTTVFTNSSGFFTGSIGSLGYWIVQQDVQRGSQPWYYYLLIQIPIYEFLPAIGLFLAIYLGLRRKAAPAPENESEEVINLLDESKTEERNFVNTFALLVWWSFISFAAFTYAGERMPWLTYHIAWPMILITGWALGRIIDTTDWEKLKQQNIPLTIITLVIFTLSTGRAIFIWNTAPPFQGQGLAELQATNAFLLPLIVSILSAIAAVYFLRTWTFKEIQRVFVLVFFGFLAVLTMRASFRASYITYDQATEFLVYAHGATGIKEVIAQAEEISKRTTGGMGIAIAYDASAPDTGVSWPFVWYLRDFTNQRSFDKPTRSLRDSVLIVVDEKNFDKIEPAIGPGYYRIDYTRMWWPMQDYFSLVYDRNQVSLSLDPVLATVLDLGQVTDQIREAFQNQGRTLSADAKLTVKEAGKRWVIKDSGIKFNIQNDQGILNVHFYEPFAKDYACKSTLGFLKLRKSKDYSAFCQWFTDPAIRAGIFQIWLNRDYTMYAQAKGRTDLEVATWSPADRMRLYIRQDVASQIWNYGIAPTETEVLVDPTEGKYISLPADRVFDSLQANPLSLNTPRSLAFANDGSMYVADSRNHRVLHLDQQGNILHEWGTYADGVSVPIGDGTFNEPWGIAVGPDGSVYVTDTLNHRVQKFSADGKFNRAWGVFGQGETPESFYGPRGLAVDAEGRVYVTDTGNKRIVVFDANGNFITQFGGTGFEPGFFDEPVGITVDKNGTVYVVYTWNQRIQTFTRFETDSGVIFTPDKQWDVFGWFGQSLDNKPFIAVNDDLHVFITDPEGYRVMEFDPSGEIVRVWGEYSDTSAGFGLASGIAVDADGNIWVTDGIFNRIMRFTLP
jgi:predicted membrane-bound mannosyltransferase/DNA-binding beta-propeller fold protein YncE